MTKPAWIVSNDKHRIEVDHGTGIFFLTALDTWEKHNRIDYTIDNVPAWPDDELEINDRLRVEPIN